MIEIWRQSRKLRGSEEARITRVKIGKLGKTQDLGKNSGKLGGKLANQENLWGKLG